MTSIQQKYNIFVKNDKRLARVISKIGPLVYETHDDPYAFLIHEIIEQMLSIKARNMIFSRLVTLCNGTVTPSQVNKLIDEQIKSIGTTNSKVTYIRNITNAVINGDLNLDSLKAKDDEVFNYLTLFKGIGKWTANMYLIFVLNRMDIILNDAAFLQSYEWLYKTNDCSDIAIRNKCTKWQPYSSIASRYLYRALDTGLTKEKFQLY